VSAGEPPNPYAAPTAALSDGQTTTGAAPSARPRKPSRVGAILLSLLAYPLAGAGLYLLGRQRRFAFWVVSTVLLWATMITAVRTSAPKLAVIAMAATLLCALAALIDTAFVKAGEARTLGRAWLIAIALFLGGRAGAFAVRLWVVEAFQIPSGAMMPTLLVGDHIFVKKGRANVARGDVIVFEYPRDRNTDYVKRVVAVGGDRLQVTGGIVSINGVALEQTPVEAECPVEPPMPGGPADDLGACKLARESNAGHAYTIMRSPDRAAADFGPITVPDGQVLVFGDNRDNSADSRIWGGVPLDHIKGTATVIYWSSASTGIRWSRIGRGIE
jgi:signal peptidase I